MCYRYIRMSTTRIHHYRNTSVEPLTGNDTINTDFYDGEPQFIPGRASLLLVPCCSENPHHHDPSDECVLINPCSYCQQSDTDFPFVAFFIANNTDIGLLIRKGDLLGNYYPAPHNSVRAQRTLLMHSHYIDLVEYGHKSCFEPIVEEYEEEEEESEDEVTIIPDSSAAHYRVKSSLRHQPPAPSNKQSATTKTYTLP
jgi:hypothetical protein